MEIIIKPFIVGLKKEVLRLSGTDMFCVVYNKTHPVSEEEMMGLIGKYHLGNLSVEIKTIIIPCNGGVHTVLNLHIAMKLFLRSVGIICADEMEEELGNKLIEEVKAVLSDPSSFVIVCKN